MPNFGPASNRSASVHQFAMVSSPEVPRSKFRREGNHKTTLNAGYLVPIYLDEVLPGDHVRGDATALTRLNTPVFPIMDNLYLETFFFFVPNRLLWDNWQRFMGERDPDTDSSIDYLIPQVTLPGGVNQEGTLVDYFGIPAWGPAGDAEVSALPFRAYNLVYKEWFRPQDLVDSPAINRGDGPDDLADYVLLRRAKRHDYFTSCLPWPQKGDQVTTPLGTIAPVLGIGRRDNATTAVDATANVAIRRSMDGDDDVYAWSNQLTQTEDGTAMFRVRMSAQDGDVNYPLVYADLSQATASSINDLRTAFQLQRMLERDARGGTRYVESIWNDFKVKSPDARMQRPEYIGGGSSMVNVSPIVQQSSTGITGSEGVLGQLSGVGTAVGRHNFQYAATEHGWIIGLANVRADLNYQQGLERMWTRQTRVDYYRPVFAHLGEQAVLRRELFWNNVPAEDETVFGYIPRWDELRYYRSKVTGRFNSNSASPLDAWHLAQLFVTAPVLGPTFIAETPPIDRVVAVDSEPDFNADILFSMEWTRPLPMHSVPGLIDHF